MPSFIEDAKAEELARRGSHEPEDALVNGAVETVKCGIRDAIRAARNEFWYIDANEWIYDSWTPLSKRSIEPGFWDELERYRTSESGIREDLLRARIYKSAGELDWDYINRVLRERLEDLGCKEIFILIGPVELTRYKMKKGLFGKKRVPNGSILVYKWAVRVAW